MISFSQHCHKVPFPFTVKPPIRGTGLYWQTAAYLIWPLRAASHHDCWFSDLTRLISLSTSLVVCRSQVIKRTFGIKGLKPPCQNNQKRTDWKWQCFYLKKICFLTTADGQWKNCSHFSDRRRDKRTFLMTSFLKNYDFPESTDPLNRTCLNDLFSNCEFFNQWYISQKPH